MASNDDSLRLTMEGCVYVPIDEDFSSLYDCRKNFYSSIMMDNDHIIEITYDDMINHRGEVIRKTWWVQVIHKTETDQSRVCNSWAGYLHSFDSLTEAKCMAFTLRGMKCKYCYDENGIKRKLH